MGEYTNSVTNKLDIPYSRGGMAQYYESLTDLIKCRLTPSIRKIVINTSVQPNGIPHFGTITTLFCAFVFAEKIKSFYSINTEVELDFIDCCPSAYYHEHGGTSCYSIARTPSSENPCLSVSDYYISTFYNPLIHWIEEASGVHCSIRPYRQFQMETAVRATVIAICNDREYFEALLDPQKRKLHIRSECPICGNIDKLLDKTEISNVSERGFTISSYCETHGGYTLDISQNNHNYIEINTQLRDIAKGALMEYYLGDGTLGIMFDGGDWGGAWTHRVHCESLQRLGRQIPLRLFAPLILDWSGGKLSKSIYLQGKISLYDSLEDYRTFLKRYGESGLQCLLEEIREWLLNPQKFFRNYSIEYILEVLNQKCEMTK